MEREGGRVVLSLHQWLTLRAGARKIAAPAGRQRATWFVAVAGLVLAALGMPGIGLAAPAGTPKLTDSGTIAYIRHEFEADASRPRPAVEIRFAAPYLYLSWRQQPGEIGGGINGVEAIRIDMRYASFDLWNLDNEVQNTIIVDCAEEYLCFGTVANRARYYHGNIDVPLFTYTGRRIVEALNHLALAYSDKRQTNPFGIVPATTTPNPSAAPEPTAPPAVSQ